MAYTINEGLPNLAGTGDVVTKSARTATGSSAWIFIGDARELAVQLDSDAGTGTTPTLDVKFRTSWNGVDATAVDVPSGAFTQVAAAASMQIKSITGTHRYIRVDWTIAGTTPSFNFGVYVTTKR